jgi:tRNA pseudouridine55 synthase
VTSPLFSRGALLLIDKPEGLTSHDVVERVRKAVEVQKIGHTGTLDPMATGLLVLCCGRAARLQGFLTGLDKSYEGTIRLGRSTTTYDREGEVTAEGPGEPHFAHEEVERAAALFRGTFDQLPPPYSAKKVGGRKFYEMARRGEEVPRAPKQVTVTRFELEAPAAGALRFRLVCSSGTYVRSIAHDLGQRLGCGAHLEELRRTRVGEFAVEEAEALDDFERMGPEARSAPPHAIPLSNAPFPFPKMTLASLEAWKIRRGQPIPARVGGQSGDWISLMDTDGEMLALGQLNPVGTGKIAMVKPRIVLAD